MSVGKGWSPILEARESLGVGAKGSLPHATPRDVVTGTGPAQPAGPETPSQTPAAPGAGAPPISAQGFGGPQQAGRRPRLRKGQDGGGTGTRHPRQPRGGPAVFTELKNRLSPARPRRTIACGRGDTGRPHTTLEDRGPCHPPPAPGLIMIM